MFVYLFFRSEPEFDAVLAVLSLFPDWISTIEASLAAGKPLSPEVVRKFPFYYISSCNFTDIKVVCHIHVAKTAGTTIADGIDKYCPHALYRGIFSETLVDPVDQFNAMLMFARVFNRSHMAFLTNHYTLDEYIRLLPESLDVEFIMPIRPLDEILVSIHTFMVRIFSDSRLRHHLDGYNYSCDFALMTFAEWLEHPETFRVSPVYSQALGIDTLQTHALLPHSMLGLFPRIQILEPEIVTSWLHSFCQSFSDTVIAAPLRSNISDYRHRDLHKELDAANHYVERNLMKEQALYHVFRSLCN